MFERIASIFSMNNKRKRLEKASLVLCGVLFLVILISGIVAYRNVPTRQWRSGSTPLPWETDNLTIEEAQGAWMNSKGHPRMQLRVRYYPRAVFKLGAINGSGRIVIRFHDAEGARRGDAIVLFYENGILKPVASETVQAEGSTVAVSIEDGFVSDKEYTLHQLDTEGNLWQISVVDCPEGAVEERPMGYISIPATDVKE